MQEKQQHREKLIQDPRTSSLEETGTWTTKIPRSVLDQLKGLQEEKT